MHASIIFTTVALVATAFANPLLETRGCPTGPYKEGSSCGENCLGALKCSENLYDVVRTTSPSPPPVLRSDCSFLFFFSPLRIHLPSTSFLPSLAAISTFPFFYPSHLESTNKVHSTPSRAGCAETPQIQCSDYTWVAFEHCEAPICSYGTC